MEMLFKPYRQSAHHELQRASSPASYWKVLTPPLSSKGIFIRSWWRIGILLQDLLHDTSTTLSYYTLHSSDQFLQQHWDPSLGSWYRWVRVREAEQQKNKNRAFLKWFGSFVFARAIAGFESRVFKIIFFSRVETPPWSSNNSLA